MIVSWYLKLFLHGGRQTQQYLQQDKIKTRKALIDEGKGAQARINDG